MNGAQKLFVAGMVATTLAWVVIAQTRSPAVARRAWAPPEPATAASSWPYPAWPSAPDIEVAANASVDAEEIDGTEEIDETADSVASDSGAASSVSNGLSLEPEQFALLDWNAWMTATPSLLRATLAEGTRDPEQVVANLFRRLFPEQAWPPTPDSPLRPTWNEMVATVGRSLERPFKPHLEIVS